jgi:hypothetical protein
MLENGIEVPDLTFFSSVSDIVIPDFEEAVELETGSTSYFSALAPGRRTLSYPFLNTNTRLSRNEDKKWTNLT